MQRKANFEEIQVVEVTENNFKSVWPYLLESLKNADVIALDMELSGLGSQKLLMSKNIEDRYEVIRQAALSRSVLSVGLAFFKIEKKDEEKRRIKLRSQVFNILTLCSQPFTIEPDALAFLSKHNFDFNLLFSSGVSYNPSTLFKSCYLRVLFNEIFCSSLPICLHNGLIDLIFLYQHFYCELPPKFSQFVNALSDLFPSDSPIVDSKYLAEYKTRMKSSFLEYIFRKCQGDNVRESISNKWHNIDWLCLGLPEGIEQSIEHLNCSLPSNFPSHTVPIDLNEAICPQFTNHGFCKKNGCDKMHDVDFALDLENERQEKERKRKRKRYDHLDPAPKKSEESPRSALRLSIADLKDKPRLRVSGCHRAGIDAFMTGFSAIFQCRMDICREGKFSENDCNKIPLSGKEIPLLIQMSTFGGSCEKHSDKFFVISNQRKKKE
ncbi:unnamed protein product [Auanema sp. JU1783]|nr:unnamed protein product [Auanema sp. JU1783]